MTCQASFDLSLDSKGRRQRRARGHALWLCLAALACSENQHDGTPAGGGSSGSTSTSSSGSGGSATSGSSNGGSGGSASSTGGTANPSGGAGAGGKASGGSEAGGTSLGCETPGLTWKSARKTYYTSYPDPGSEECIEYNGCTWAGEFAACQGKKPEAWVEAHNIVAAFPDFDTLMLHDLCLRSGDKTLVVTVLDTCADSDCSGCCTQNQGDADQLIDLESYTNDRWGVEDGQIEWADLGPTQGDGCN